MHIICRKITPYITKYIVDHIPHRLHIYHTSQIISYILNLHHISINIISYIRKMLYLASSLNIKILFLTSSPHIKILHWKILHPIYKFKNPTSYIGKFLHIISSPHNKNLTPEKILHITST